MYKILEPQYTQAEKRRAEYSEGYKEGYEQAVESACMDAQEHCWIDYTEQVDQMSYQRHRKERSPDLQQYDFDEVYNEDEDEWVLSDDDQEWVEEFYDGWNDAHTKHYNKMIEIMKSPEKKSDRNNYD